MLTKLLIAVLSVLLIGETAYLLSDRRLVGRFQNTDPELWLGFDTATGQLCRLVPEVVFDFNIEQGHTVDPDSKNAKIYLSLPLCRDIR